ncbi:MAG: hypothetical protein QW350_05580 [Candidatus Aenigmatarchaeota archaeon]|jgi:thioredoxin-related protein
MSKPYKFIIVTSNSCFHCTRFKKEILSSLQDSIIKKGNIEIIHINIERFDFPSKGYPKGLKNLVQWYPTFILIPSKYWENIEEGIKTETIFVFNGKYNNEGYAMLLEKRRSITLEELLKWIDENIQNLQSIQSKQRIQVKTESEKKIVKKTNNSIKFIDRIL